MKIASVRRSSLEELQSRAKAIVVACGYEHRSQGVTSLLSRLPEGRHALCFKEFSTMLARRENEAFFEARSFRLHNIGANDSIRVEALIAETVRSLHAAERVIAFDISTMTRAWHGAIARHLRFGEYESDIETFFAYTPAVFQVPNAGDIQNEFVSPVRGFSSLSAPDLPVAVIIGLGYEKEGALGLQQLLDPALTVLLVPNGGDTDKYHPLVLKNNADIMERTPGGWTLDYSLEDPAGTFAMLVSLIGGIRQSYRIVLASLGPKMFGLLCFLLASEFPDVSVWRVSSGIHGKPRDSYPAYDKTVVLDVMWSPRVS